MTKGSKWTRLRAMGVAVLLLGAVLGVVEARTAVGTRIALAQIARAVTGVEATTVEAASISGSRLTSLRISDLRLSVGDFGEVATVGLVELKYRFLPLLRRSLVIDRAEFSGVRVDLRECSTGWYRDRAPTPVDSTEAVWTISLDELSVFEGAATGGACVDTATWSVEAIHASITGVRTSPRFEGQLSDLQMEIRPSGSSTDYTAHLGLTGALQSGVLTIDSLRLRSPGSEVTAQGVLRTLTAPPGTPDIDFDVHADPLAFADIEPLIPSLVQDGSARMDATLTSSDDILGVIGFVEILGGGRIDMDATFAENDSDDLRYSGTVTMASLDAATLVRDAPIGQMDGLVDFDLEGPTLDSLSGDLTIAASTAPASEVDRELRLDATLSQGRADLSGRFAVDIGSGTIGGWVRPFSQQREAEVQGEFDYATPDGAPTSAVMTGGYDIALSFDDWRTASGRGAIVLGPSSLGHESIPEASLVVELEDGAGSWRAESLVGLGRIDAGGTLHLADQQFDIENADFRDVDLSSLFGGESGSAVNGVVAATRTEGVSSLGDWTGRIALAETSIGSFVTDSTSIDFALEGSRLVFDVDTRAFTGSASARIEGDLDGDLRMDITRSSFRGIDPSAPSGIGDGSSALSGTATGSWSAGGARPSRLSIVLGDSRIRRMQVGTGTVNIILSGDSAVVDASLFPTSAEILIQGSRSGDPENPTWRLDEVRFSNFDFAALAESGDTPARGTGRITGTWEGQDVSRLTGEARLELERSEVGPWQLKTATVDATIANGTSNVVGSVEADGFSGEVEATAELPRQGAMSRGTARFQGTVKGIVIDSVYAAASYDSASLAVDTLQVWSAAALADGRATLLLEPARLRDFSLIAALHQAEALRSWFGLELDALGRADVVATGGAVGDSVEVSSQVTGVGLSYGTVQVEGFSGSGRGFIGASGSVSYTEVRLEANTVRAGRLPVERVRIDASPEADGMVVAMSAIVDDERQLTALIATHPTDEGTTVEVRGLSIDLMNQGWDLDGTPTLHIAEGVTVQDLTLVSRSRSGRMTANGTIGQGGTQSLAVNVDGLELAGLSDIIGYEGLEGIVGGSLDLGGTALDPTVAGAVRARGTLGTSDQAELIIDIGYESQIVTVDGSLELGAGESARLSGTVPMQVTFAPVDSTDRRVALLPDGSIELDLTAQQIGLQWLGPWVMNENLREVTGVLNGELHVTGTPARLSQTGEFEVRNVAAFLPVVGLRLREGRLDGHFEPERLVITQLQALSGDGRVTGSGAIQLSGTVPGEIQFDIALDDFLAIRNDVFRAVADGDLTVLGTAKEPIVAGSLDVLSGDVFLGGRFASAAAEVVELNEEDYATLAARFGYRPPEDSPLTRTAGAGALALDVRVRVGRDTWVRQRANPALSVQFTGDLRVEKAPNELEQVFGRLEAVPRGSYVEQFGRRFSITSGSVDFNGPMPDLRLDVAGEYAVPARGDPTASEVVIELGVVGGLTDLGLVLSSQPQMENADIVSYLATGRPASQSMQFGSSGSSQLVERGTTMALGRATSAVERLASESVGLDVMQIRSEGSRGVTVVAGRYVSPRLYLGFKQPIGFRRADSSAGSRTRSPEVEIEYQALRWLLLNLQREGSRIDFFLRSRYAY